MGKVIPFRRIKKETAAQKEAMTVQLGFEQIHAIVNDDSLTAAHRHWLLENMLMQIDAQLEHCKNELEKAERTLHDLVRSAEANIASTLDRKKLRRFTFWREAGGRERAS